ncbi:MAG: D-aminoacyl-tRNA deacylase [Candidatus Woesearchaeota archaeon]
MSIPKIVFFYGKEDPAGKNLAKHLKEQCPDTYLIHELDSSPVHAEHVDQNIDCDICIFLTKHDSVSGIPSLCIHTQGNWSSNDLGGNPFEIGVCPVVLKNLIYRNLVAQNKKHQLGFDVVHEATHHGPSLEKPTIFVEIGSTKKEWVRDDAASCVIQALLCALEKYSGEKETGIPVVFGIGGNHTCSHFNRLSAEGKILLSHVVPNYKIDEFTSEMMQQGLTRSTLKAQAMIDWKALKSSQRQKIIHWLEQMEESYIRLDHFKKQQDNLQ